MRTNRRPAPEPLETNDTLVVALGTAAWAVALVVLLIVGDRERWAWVAAAGVFLGLVGLRHVRRRAARRNPPS